MVSDQVARAAPIQNAESKIIDSHHTFSIIFHT